MRLLLGIIMLVLLFEHKVLAEPLDNHAFSYSEFGMENITYAESILVGGYALDMSQSVQNPVQRSGGYTPFSENTGFYVQTSTTLIPYAAREEWDISPFGIVQNNLRKVRWNQLNTLFAWHLSDLPIHLVSGVGITTLSFTRLDFQKDVGASSFEAAIAPTTFTVFPGAITEDSTNITANFGVRYDSTFSQPQADSRLQASFLLGTPMYYRVENSQFPGVAWVENFNGYDVSADLGYAIRVYEEFMLSIHGELLYKKRLETHGEPVVGGVGRIPEVTIWNARLTTGLSWTF